MAVFRRLASLLLAVGVLGPTACGPGPSESLQPSAAAEVDPTADLVAPPTPSPTPMSAEPTPTPTVTPGPPEAERHEYGDDPAQIGWLRVPVTENPAPVVVLFHGGFWAEPWDYTLMSDLAAGLSERGFATWNIEFRRLRGRGGWPATFDDVRSAIDHLAVLADSHPLDTSRVVAFGHSSGGHLALWSVREDVVTRPPVQRAIGLAAITDLSLTAASTTLLGGSAEEYPDRWAAAAPSLDPERVLLIHGTDDEDIPLFAVANAVEAGVELIEVAGDHFSVLELGSAGHQDVVDIVVEQLD